MESKQFKAYEYNTIMRLFAILFPIFMVIVAVASAFGKFRYLLYFTIVAATYRTFLNKLKKKIIFINFTERSLNVNSKEIFFADIENYHICLPLRKYFMLRLKTTHKKEVFYISVDNREEIEKLMTDRNLIFNKTKNDLWLKYSPPIIFLLLYLITLYIIMFVYNKIY